MVKVTKQTSGNSRMNLSHTLARKETKQQTSIPAERNFTTAKTQHTTSYNRETGDRKKHGGTKTKGGKRKMKPDNLRKTDGSE